MAIMYSLVLAMVVEGGADVPAPGSGVVVIQESSYGCCGGGSHGGGFLGKLFHKGDSGGCFGGSRHQTRAVGASTTGGRSRGDLVPAPAVVARTEVGARVEDQDAVADRRRVAVGAQLRADRHAGDEIRLGRKVRIQWLLNAVRQLLRRNVLACGQRQGAVVAVDCGVVVGARKMRGEHHKRCERRSAATA